MPSAVVGSLLTVDLDLAGAALSASKTEVGFVQIGAFDGEANDPIHDLIRDFGWRGVLVEPVPATFKKLQQTYADVDGLVLLNVAVGTERGHIPFWRISGEEPGDPWWRGQVSSFDRAHVMKHIRDNRRLEARLMSEPVETMTLADVLDRAPRPVDVLQIDTEGRDAEIVDSLDLESCRPVNHPFRAPASDAEGSHGDGEATGSVWVPDRDQRG